MAAGYGYLNYTAEQRWKQQREEARAGRAKADSRQGEKGMGRGSAAGTKHIPK